MMNWKMLILAGAMALLPGCSNEAKPVETKTETVAETSSVAEETENQEDGTLASVAMLLGMKDSETKSMLGGGEENWTSDRSFYIGRIFQAEVYGEIYPVYTTCSESGMVESVSMQIVSGERKVTEEEIEQWSERISQYTEVLPSEEKGPSETGSRQKVWIKDDKIVTLYYMEDNLSISFQNLIGELDEEKSTDTGERQPEGSTTEYLETKVSAEVNSSENKGETETAAENTRTDNFAVDSAEAKAFAVNIKEAVSEKDLEALADMTGFPLYIGFAEGGQFVESKEDFISLGQEKIFTEELIDSVAQADETALSPSQAGFILTKENGAPNIVFGLREGQLAVLGINY